MLPSDLKLITKADAAEAFSVSVKTIDNYIKDGKLPPPTLFVSKEYWHPEDFRAFLEQTFRRHSSGPMDSTQALAPTAAGLECQIPETTKKQKSGEAKNSPAVRQRSRQAGLLSRLNSR